MTQQPCIVWPNMRAAKAMIARIGFNASCAASAIWSAASRSNAVMGAQWALTLWLKALALGIAFGLFVGGCTASLKIVTGQKFPLSLPAKKT